MNPLQFYSPAGDFASRRPEIPLTTGEILEFYNEITTTGDDSVSVEELQARLAQTYRDLGGILGGKDAEADEHEGLRAFMGDLVPSDKKAIRRSEFVAMVQSWNVPSREQADGDAESIRRTRMPWNRRLQSWISIRAGKIIFISVVVALQLALGLYYLIRYRLDKDVYAALGNGITVAKGCAGVIYPTMFFLLLSMSRWATTWLRRYLPYGNLINWDRSRSFHIRMACTATVFGTLHGLAHLTGSYVIAIRPANREAVATVFQLPITDPQPPYLWYMRLLPSWTGIVALALFYIIGALAHPKVRRWNYEVFQSSHLLMFPLIGLLCAHGTSSLLQPPVLMYWMAAPMLLIFLERSTRVVKTFFPVSGCIRILDKDAVTLTCKSPANRVWTYHAGQFVFLNVPSLSRFQWHPFTISACDGQDLQLTIKSDGNWTKRLRGLSGSVQVAIDGPYGAPSQRFYEFDRSIIVGAGVGVTPFSAILTDLEQKLSAQVDPWAKKTSGSRPGTVRGNLSRAASSMSLNKLPLTRSASTTSLATTNSASKPTPPVESKPDLSVCPPDPTIDNILTTIHSTSPTAKRISVLLPPPPPPPHAATKSPRRPKLPRTTSTPSPLPHRRIAFHWLVRSRTTLSWFSALLNRAHDLARSLPPELLALTITCHVTASAPASAPAPLSLHIFRYLLDSYRTPSSPVSLLSGLKARSRFGRPDLRRILDDFGRGVLAEEAAAPSRSRSAGGESEVGRPRERRIGVFFCGAPGIGQTLQGECARLNRRSRERREGLVWVFLGEVFG